MGGSSGRRWQYAGLLRASAGGAVEGLSGVADGNGVSGVMLRLSVGRVWRRLRVARRYVSLLIHRRRGEERRGRGTGDSG